MNLIATAVSKITLTEALESQLGDPSIPDNPLSFAYSQKIDETEQFPHEAIRWLYERQLARHYVPEELGGSFRSFAELGELIRVLSRRDVSSAVAFSTLFWSFLAWTGGTPGQKRWLASYILERQGAMCLAYSEKEHGADLAASDTVARRTADGFEITGEKWPINRATIGGLCFVLATTDPAAGPRGLSLFMLDKSGLDPERFSNLPKNPHAWPAWVGHQRHQVRKLSSPGTKFARRRGRRTSTCAERLPAHARALRSDIAWSRGHRIADHIEFRAEAQAL